MLTTRPLRARQRASWMHAARPPGSFRGLGRPRAAAGRQRSCLGSSRSRRRVPRPCARERAVYPAAQEAVRLPGASSAPGGAAVGEVAGLPRGRVDGGRPGQANEPREGAEAGGRAMATGCAAMATGRAPPPLAGLAWPRGRPSPASRHPTQQPPLPTLPRRKAALENCAGSEGSLPCPPQCEWAFGLSDQRAPAPLGPALWVRCRHS